MLPGDFTMSVCLAGQGVTSSSCPWQQKEKKILPVPCVTSSSSYGSKRKIRNRASQGRGRAGARQGKGEAGQGRASRAVKIKSEK
jgi:hypothetical protein